jgi:hypothetical protein
MKRFVNSIVVLGLMWLGTLMTLNAWVWLAYVAGFWAARGFAFLMIVAAVCEHTGPALAQGYIDWRVRVAKAAQS